MNPVTQSPQTVTTNATSVRRNEFLTFVLGNEEYGIEILKVQEIRGYETATAIANTPEFIKGVLNLRGVNGRLRWRAPFSE